MAPTIPTSVPSTLVAGTAIEFDLSYPDFPASEYALALHLRGPSDADFDGDSIDASGDTFQVRIASDETGNLVAGTHVLTPRFTKDGNSHVAFDASGAVVRYTVTVLADPVADVGVANHDELVLAAINASIEGADLTIKQEQILSRAVEYFGGADLPKLQGIYRQRVNEARYPDRGFQRMEGTFVAPR